MIALIDLNYNFECDWLIGLCDNRLPDNKLSDNRLSDNKLSDINLTIELGENRRFSNQSQSRKLSFLWLKSLLGQDNKW